MFRLTFLLSLFAVFSVIGAAAQDDPGTIADIASANEDFSTLVTAVVAADLVDVLADPNAQWTVFAPTNDAFAALPEGALEMLLDDTELLTRVLTYHVVQGAITSDQLTSMMAPSMEMTAPDAPTLGSELEITVGEDGTVMVNDATVTTADIIASNGVIHVIDSVLLPPDVAMMLMGDDMPMEQSLWVTLNPAGIEDDAVTSLSYDLMETVGVFDGFADLTDIQSAKFTTEGTAYLTVDVTAETGALVVIEGLANADSMAVGTGTRTIGGANAGLVTPKGLEIIEALDLVLVANTGASNIKGFSLSAEGDVAPTVFIDGFPAGSIWDIHYDATTDMLFAAGTTGTLFIFEDFSTTLGSNAPRAVVPSDAAGVQISVNLHGVAYDAMTDTVILTDVGSAADNADGQIYTIEGISTAEGATPVALRIAGEGTKLGNPVDVIFDGANIFVAEKANDVILRYDDILSLMSDVTAADFEMTALKPESLTFVPTEMMDETMMDQTIVDIASADENFSTLVTAVIAADLVDVLADPNAQWTVFAPTNDAFAALPEGALEMLLGDTELLTRVLTYHVVQGAITSDQLTSMMAPSMEMTAPDASLLGSELEITVGDDGTVMVNDATVIMADIIASNGVIHVIDSILLPPDIAAMLME